MKKNFLKVMLTAMVIVSASSASGQVLYKIEGNGLKDPSYIFGTHHVAPLAVAQQFGAVEPFNAATQIAGEIDLTQSPTALAMALQPHMKAPSDSTLSKVISPEDMEVISAEFKKWAPIPEIELSMLEGLKPMVASSMVVMGMYVESMPGFDPQAQLDSWFQTTGKAEGKTIIPLETAEQQAGLLYDFMPISVQAEELVNMLKEPTKSIEHTKALSEAYIRQDLKAMYDLSMEDESHPEFMEALIDRRNTDWLSKLPAIFQQGSTFVAVGALHLAGDKGVIAGLRKAGYTVTPIEK